MNQKLGKAAPRSRTPEKLLNKRETEDWFHRNLRGYEAKKATVYKDKMKDNTNMKTQL